MDEGVLRGPNQAEHLQGITFDSVDLKEYDTVSHHGHTDGLTFHTTSPHPRSKSSRSCRITFQYFDNCQPMTSKRTTRRKR